jgi:thiaminase/transcriptional activator TenA
VAEQAASETFVEYARRTGLRFSDWLRDQAEPAWTRAVEHRFTHEIADDALDESVFKRYLTNEYSFVVTAATLLGYAIAKAPSMDEKARLAEGLRGLTTEQRAFFMRAFEALGIPEVIWSAPIEDPAVLAFRDTTIRAAAHGGYEEALATMLAAEWMYATWSQRAHRRHPRHPYYAEWIALHVTPEFEGHADWLRDRLDHYGPLLAPYRQAEVVYIFRRTLELEVAFHDAAYRT